MSGFIKDSLYLHVLVVWWLKNIFSGEGENVTLLSYTLKAPRVSFRWPYISLVGEGDPDSLVKAEASATKIDILTTTRCFNGHRR